MKSSRKISLLILSLLACLVIPTVASAEILYFEPRMIDTNEGAWAAIDSIDAYFIDTGDIDNDGDIDIAWAVGSAMKRFYWLENDGAGTFTPHEISPTEFNTGDVKLTDVDGDGDLDIVALSVHSAAIELKHLMLFTNNLIGSGVVSFTESMLDEYYIPDGVGNDAGDDYPKAFSRLMLADVDNDADDDLLVLMDDGNGHDKVYWYEKSGGSFIRHLIFEDWAGTYAYDEHAMDIQDINADGYPDLVTVSDRHISLWMNDQDGTFSEVNITTTGDDLHMVQFKDLDEDGLIDIVCGGGATGTDTSGIIYLRNAGTSDTPSYSWIGRNSISTEFSPPIGNMGFKDIDSDGDIDIFTGEYSTANPNRSGMYFLENDGSENFTKKEFQSVYADSTRSFHFADMDGDSNADDLIVVMDWGAGDYYAHAMLWFNIGYNSDFTKHIADPDIDGAFSIKAGDMDGDSDIDMVVAANDANAIYILENDGSQNYTRHTVYSSYTNAYSVEIGDLDGDGDMDILAYDKSSNDIKWFKNDGTPYDAEWEYQLIDGNTYSPSKITLVDLDGDGDNDIVSHGATATGRPLFWYETSESGGIYSFTEHYLDDVNTASYDFEVVDIDEDGFKDIVAAIFDTDQVVIFRNDGFESFSKIVVDSSLDEASSASTADVDGDGDLDIVASGYAGNKIVWFENDGTPLDGGWITHTVLNRPEYFVLRARPVDIDSDGDMDIVSITAPDDNDPFNDYGARGDSDTILTLWKNDGTGSFTEASVDSSVLWATDIDIADIDGDGMSDLIITDQYADDVVWFENLNTGNTPPTISVSPVAHNSDTSLNAVDNEAIEDEIITLTGTCADNEAGDALTAWFTYSSGLVGGESVTVEGHTTGSEALGSVSTVATATFAVPDIAANREIIFTLHCNDTSETVTDTITVYTNAKPSADAGDVVGDVSEATELQLALIATTPSASDTDALTYTWTETSACGLEIDDDAILMPTLTIPQVIEACNVVMELSVSDGKNDPVTDTLEFTISGSNDQLTSLDAGPDKSGRSGTSVTTEASAAIDPEEQTVQYTWSVLSNSCSESPTINSVDNNNTSVSLPDNQFEECSIVMNLSATDGVNPALNDTMEITVTNLDATPVIADAGADRTMLAGRVLGLNGSNSSGEGELDYIWRIVSGGGSLSDGLSATPSYTIGSSELSQDIVIELLIIDSLGNSDSDEMTIHVIKSVSGETLRKPLAGGKHGSIVYEQTDQMSSGEHAKILLVGSDDDATIEMPDDTVHYAMAITNDGYLVIGLPAVGSSAGMTYLTKEKVSDMRGAYTIGNEIASQSVGSSKLATMKSTKASTVGDFKQRAGEGTDSRFGEYVRTGDMDGDGIDEIIVAAPGSGNYGAAYVYDMTFTLVSVIFGSAENPISSIMMGEIVTRGEGNNSDVAFGPSNTALNANLNFGPLGRIDSSSNVSILSGDIEFGTTIEEMDMTVGSGARYVAYASGDLNGDGIRDIAMSTTRENVYIFFGPIDLSTFDYNLYEADAVIRTDTDGDGFGEMIAIADMSGDGTDDIAIGEPRHGDDDIGAIHIIFGSNEWNDEINIGSVQSLAAQGTNMDVSNIASNIVTILGEAADDGIGGDIMAVDLTGDGTAEIYTVKALYSTYMISLSEAISEAEEPEEEAEATGFMIQGGGGCLLEIAATPHMSCDIPAVLVILFPIAAMIIARKKQKPSK
jgi:VCBS repeat protein/FG-GAP repeat protein